VAQEIVPSTERDQRPGQAHDRSRWLALGVLCTGMLMIVLDATVVNVALPAIQNDLGFSQSSLAWVVNAYLIAFGGLLLLAGRIGDLTSRRGVFQVGLAVFTVASVLCGVAQSAAMLVAARFAQGVGGAMTSAVKVRFRGTPVCSQAGVFAGTLYVVAVGKVGLVLRWTMNLNSLTELSVQLRFTMAVLPVPRLALPARFDGAAGGGGVVTEIGPV
jgi:MFS family permease